MSRTYLQREYSDRRRSSVELANELGCSHKTVLHYLELHRIPVRGRGQRRARFPELHSVSFLEKAYVVERRSPSEIASAVGCSRSAVVRAVRALNLTREPALTPDALRPDALAGAYVRDGRSTTSIAREAGCAAATVVRYLRRYGIPVRSGAPSVPRSARSS